MDLDPGQPSSAVPYWGNGALQEDLGLASAGRPAEFEDPILDAGLVSELPLDGQEWAVHPLEIDGRHRGAAEIGLATEEDETLAFYMKYEGEDAERFHWLQFVWGEILGLKDGVWQAVPARVYVSVGAYETTLGGTLDTPGRPDRTRQVLVDGAIPWKDEMYLQSPSAVGATDGPTFKRSALVDAMSQHELEAAKLREHFEVFLVRDERKVVDHQVITMDWDPLSAEGANPASQPVALTMRAGEGGAKLREPFASVFADATSQLDVPLAR